MTGFNLGFPIKYHISLLSNATEPLLCYTTKSVLLIQGSWLFYKGISAGIAEKFKFPGQICQKDYVWFVYAGGLMLDGSAGQRAAHRGTTGPPDPSGAYFWRPMGKLSPEGVPTASETPEKVMEYPRCTGVIRGHVFRR